MESLLTVEERLKMLEESLKKNQADNVWNKARASIYQHAFKIALNSLYTYFPELKEDDTKTT